MPGALEILVPRKCCTQLFRAVLDQCRVQHGDHDYMISVARKPVYLPGTRRLEISMRLCVVMVVALELFVAADAQDDVIKEEMKNLQGTWVRIYVDVEGKKSEDGKKAPG